MVGSRDLSRVQTISSKIGLLQTPKLYLSKEYQTLKILKHAAQEQTKKWLSQNLTTGVNNTQIVDEKLRLKSTGPALPATFIAQSVLSKIEFAWVANKSLDYPHKKF